MTSRQGDKQEAEQSLEKQLSYWKGHMTLKHVLANELSYSLIYDNIRQDKVREALATVGLTALPNRFFLIQVDDYQQQSSGMRITKEFFQKTELIDLLQSCIEEMALSGFVANLVGLDKMICFLCCEEWETEEIDRRLLAAADRLKERVRIKSTYTISICISERCVRIGQYSQMYPRMDLALSKSYFSGKEFSILLKNVAKQEPRTEEADLNQFYPEMLAAVIRGNSNQFEASLQRILQTARACGMTPQKIKVSVVRLMQRISDYCVRCGVSEHDAHALTDACMYRVLACSFIADMHECLRSFFLQITETLASCRGDTKYSIRTPVAEYIATHYAGTIRLKELADMMGFSEGHFARLFHQEFGVSFVQYLTEYRIRRSKRLLATTDFPIEQIAYQVGMNSYSYFCTCFKRSQGMTPGAYRVSSTGYIEKLKQNV